jgi:hypothetical protein
LRTAWLSAPLSNDTTTSSPWSRQLGASAAHRRSAAALELDAYLRGPVQPDVGEVRRDLAPHREVRGVAEARRDPGVAQPRDRSIVRWHLGCNAFGA